MKRTFLILILVATAGSIIASEPATPHDTKSSNETNAMKTDLDGIVTAVFRVFLKQHATAESEVRIYYIGGDDGARVKLSDFASPSYSLKVGQGYEFRDGRYRDKETGQLCKVVALKIVSVDGEVATATVEWRQALLAAGGTAYQLKKKNGVWEIEKVVGSFAS